jgi:hypothetical protein
LLLRAASRLSLGAIAIEKIKITHDTMSINTDLLFFFLKKSIPEKIINGIESIKRKIAKPCVTIKTDNK